MNPLRDDQGFAYLVWFILTVGAVTSGGTFLVWGLIFEACRALGATFLLHFALKESVL